MGLRQIYWPKPDGTVHAVIKSICGTTNISKNQIYNVLTAERRYSRKAWSNGVTDTAKVGNYSGKFNPRPDRRQLLLHETLDSQTTKQRLPVEGGDAGRTADCVSRDFYLNGINHAHHPQLCSILSKGNFTVYYNQLNKTPCWVYEFLTSDSLSKSTGSRKKSQFCEDTEVEEHYGSSLDDYRRSGYDRGHVAAAGNHRSSQDAINQTFLLSNILPQVGKGFNQDIWRHLEEGIRDIAVESRCVHLYTGPLYIPRKDKSGGQYVSYPVIGGNRVAVPTHLFKTMLIVTNGNARDGNFLLSFVMPNVFIDDSSQISDFVVSLKDIHVLSGMRFFSLLNTRRLGYQEIVGEKNDDSGFLQMIRDRRVQAMRRQHEHGDLNSRNIS